MSSQPLIVSKNAVNNKNRKYDFLKNQPQTKGPTQPLPPVPQPPSPVIVVGCTRTGSSTIAAWAARVQPGSPAPISPHSPHRRPSISRRPSASRRPSVSRHTRRPSARHTRTPSTSPTFLNFIHTPPSAKLDFDLTTLGYNSVFIHLPKTPSTPSPFIRESERRQQPPSPVIPIPPIPTTPPPRAPPRRFRSLSILRRPRAKSAATMPSKSITKSSKSSVTPTSPSTVTSPKILAATILKRNKAKYAFVPPPPSLSVELALMQFADGGSTNDNVRRLMAAQAAAAGPNAGVGDVYRDGKGGLWWDREEEMEYEHLLSGGQETQGLGWVSFADNDEDTSSDDNENAVLDLDFTRRDSVSSQDSDLDPKYMMQTTDVFTVPAGDVLTTRRLAPSMLSLPARPRRAAKHLCKPEFLVDIAAFAPRSPGPRSPKSPRRNGMSFEKKPKGKARRRPTPLQLAPAASGWKPDAVTASRRPSTAEVADPDKSRKDFIADSFAPVLSPSQVPVRRSSRPAPTPLQEPTRVPPVPHASAHINVYTTTKYVHPHPPPPTPPSPGVHRLVSKLSLSKLKISEDELMVKEMKKKPSRKGLRGLFSRKTE